MAPTSARERLRTEGRHALRVSRRGRRDRRGDQRGVVPQRARDWTRPEFGAPGSHAELVDVVIRWSPTRCRTRIALGPRRGVMITGSNMSGKSTFLRTVGATIVMAQTVNTCLASRYEAPPFIVRSCIGRTDDILAGKSYYIVEVESVLGLVAPARRRRRTCSCSTSCSAGPTPSSGSRPARRCSKKLLVARQSTPSTMSSSRRRTMLSLSSCWRTDTTPITSGITGTRRTRLRSPSCAGAATSRNAIALLRINGAPDRLIARAHETAARLDDLRGDQAGASVAAIGSHSSTLLPSGSMTQANLPFSSVSGPLRISTPFCFSCASIPAMLSTR